MSPRNKGFTIVEIIVVVAVMAILSSMTAPALIQMIQKRDAETEKIVLDEITKALGRYAIAQNEIPNDDPTLNVGGEDWATLLASYTNYSADQLRIDTWGQERAYTSHQETERFLNTDINIAYATIHSSGVNIESEGGVGIPLGSVVNGFTTFAEHSDLSWWANSTAPVTQFANIGAEGDDLMTKFTNYQNIINNYNITLERAQSIAGALESYSQSKYTEALLFENALPDGDPAADPNINIRIYFPPSQPESGTDGALYSPYVISDMGGFSFGSDNRVASSTNDALRYTEMVQLMRLLGLPDSYCCNAMERFDSGGDSVEKPFHYFSNPRPRGPGATGCGTRPSTGGNNLSPRLSLSIDAKTCG